ncbi:MAG: ABC transporter substrate-binding protein [Clostridiales bacterium]|nr:ABC transporter substrate-binding protein [Clostridiales bacterium]
MKKMFALLLALAMTLSLAACGGSSSTTTEEDTTSSAATEDAAADKTADSSAEAAAATDATGETYTVGIVNWGDDASLNQIVENIQTELAAKGEELGCTFEVNYDNAQADATVLNQIGADMVASQVDVIVAVATPVATVMQATTEDTDIPVVFSAVSDPVGAGLVESMEEPGGNVTGTSDALDTTAIMNLMLAADPDLELVGLLYDTAQDSSTQPIEDAKAWCDENGIAYEEKTGSTTDDILLATQSLITDGVDAVFTPSDNTVMTAELTIYELLQEAQIPHYAGADSFALNGAFCGYGVDYSNLGVMTADMVVDLLVSGADPATTPVMTFDNGIATINTETCEAIGFDLDTIKETFAPLCTEVVEIQTAEEFE